MGKDEINHFSKRRSLNFLVWAMISFMKRVNFGERRQLKKLVELEKLSRAKR